MAGGSYDIYIRAIGGGSYSDQTVPWSQRQSGGGDAPTTSQSGGFSSGNLLNGVATFGRFAQNPDSMVSTGIGALAKAAPWVAAACVVVSAGIKAFETALDFETLESGDHSSRIAIDNARTSLHIILTPVSSTINHFRTEKQWQVTNYKREKERDLLGDSVINSYTGRGV